MNKKISPDHRAIVLASGSPRRQELVRRIGLEPIVIVSDVPEKREPAESPEEYTCRLAELKARHVARRSRTHGSTPLWVLSADTVVVFEEEVLEKPSSPDEAFHMLKRLSGHWHTVITSFCWWYEGDVSDNAVTSVRSVSARVQFRTLPDEMIRRYVQTGEPMDKAGAYGIQDLGSTMVRKIEGSYFCVVGLPVCEVIEELEALGGIEHYPFLDT